MLSNSIRKIILTTLFAVNFAKQPIAPEAISISGYVELVDLNNNIPIYLVMNEGHLFAYLDILIYVDEVLENQTRVLTSSISKKPYYINGFNNKNQIKNIKIMVCYVDEGIEDSQIQFTLKAPSYKSVSLSGSDNIEYIESNPIKTYFSFQGNNYSVDYEYEKISLKSKVNYELENSRFIDFNNYSIDVKTLRKFEINRFELRLYCHFDNSDLIYVNNLYTALDIKMEKLSDNYFQGINEFSVYVDERDGSIRYTSNEYTNKDLLPFFIPFSVGDKFEIEYSVVFYDVGMNHNDYIFNGIISKDTISNNQFGKQYNFKYVLIDEEIEGVEYVS